MTVQFALEPAFVLHSRPFRDTSLLVELFTQNNGRRTIVARGVRKARSLSCGLLQPFIPLMILLSGKGELLNLKKIEANGLPHDLQGRRLLIGFYLNELLLKLLHKEDPQQNVYRQYENALLSLSDSNNDNLRQQAALRIFELELTKELGYGLELNKDIEGKEVLPNEYYIFKYGEGFIRVNFDYDSVENLFAGSSLLSFYKRSLIKQSELKDTKKLMQIVLAKLLNGKIIKTRELF